MTIWQAAALGILATGAAGYVVALAMVLRLRWWLGPHAPRWPRILLRSLALCLVGLGGLYAISIGAQLGLLRGAPRLAANVVAAVFLAAAPWALSWGLHQWRREVERRGLRPPWQREPAERGIDDD